MLEENLNHAAFAVDGLTPERVVAPTTEDETAQVLAAAREAGQAVIPVGGGTMLAVGNAPERYDLALSTARLTGIVEYNPADLTVVARSGTTMAELEWELARRRQFLPLQPPLPRRSTLGGVLAANAAGPWRAAFGSARDLVIGMRMALPSGSVAKSGGRVVKNVAGYDIAKLFIGSYGSLGIIVEAALKVYPSPAVTRTVTFQMPDVTSALRLAATLRTTGPGLLTLAVVNATFGQRAGLGGAGIVAMVGGTARAAGELAETVRSVDSAAGRLIGEDDANKLFDLLRDFPAEATVKASTLPTRVSDALAAEGPVEALAYPAIGLTYIRLAAPSAEIKAHRELLMRGGGSLVLLRADPELKRAVDAWGVAGPELTLMRKVKNVFDPSRVLSPGRFVGVL